MPVTRSGTVSPAEPFKYEFKWFKDDFDTDPKTRGRLFVHRSALEEERSRWEPPLPSMFGGAIDIVPCPEEDMLLDPKVVKKWPEFQGMVRPVLLRATMHLTHREARRVGIILTGEWVPSSGTHNVIVGIVRAVTSAGGSVLGFLGGPQGFARQHFVELTPAKVNNYLNQGGADLLGFGSLRAIDESDYAEILALATNTYNLDGLVFIGGPNELAHVSQLVQCGRGSDAEKSPIIVGVFQSPNSNIFVPTWIPVTLGFDSARAALQEYVGNIARDGLSSGRPTEVNIIRCGSTTMTMEIALQVGPAATVLGDEIRALNVSVAALVRNLTELIRERITSGRKTTTVLMSDKFYACLVGFPGLQAECRALYVSNPMLVCPSRSGGVNPDLFDALTPISAELLAHFPPTDQLRIARAYDADGNPTQPEIEPERFLGRLLQISLGNVSPVIRTHNIGQEGRCPLPTEFDSALGLALGYTAAALVSNPACSGYIASVRNLAAPVAEWECGGFPIAPLLSVAPELTDTLTGQYGGANQELINLAKQRVERESTVPQISLRPLNILNDCLYQWFKAAEVEIPGQSRIRSRQPGPHQFCNKVQQRSYALQCVDGKEAMKVGTEGVSDLEKERLTYVPNCPSVLRSGKVVVVDSGVTTHRSRIDDIQVVFPNTSAVAACTLVEAGHLIVATGVRVGIVFLGRHAAGSHNVVFGLLEALPPDSTLLGFTNGAVGLLLGEAVQVTAEMVSRYKNLSGIEMLGRTEHPIRTSTELAACVRTCRKLRLDGLVVVGGLGTHADTALLAEAVATARLPTRVIGVPASIENDIPLVEQSLGHDTACRVYSGIVGSLATLAASSKRQWCFVRISGRSLSHVLLEVAMQTHPNLVLVAEEIAARRLSLADTVNLIADLITERANNGYDFGVVIFPENILTKFDETVRYMNDPDSAMSVAIAECLPERARKRLQEPELLLAALVGKELQRRRMFAPNNAKSLSAFKASTHVLSHQGRTAMPSDFDCDLGYSLGAVSAHIIASNRTGLLVTMANLSSPPSEWEVRGIPLTSLLTVTAGEMESRIEIDQRPVDFGSKSLPPPSRRRFVSPGPLQFAQASGELLSLARITAHHRNQQEQLETVSKLCSEIMTVSACATDETVKEVLRAGVAHTLTLLRGYAKLRPEGNSEESTKSHARVVKIVPLSST